MSVESIIYAQNNPLPPTRRQQIMDLITQEAAKFGVTYGEVMSRNLKRGGITGHQHHEPTKPVCQARAAAMIKVRDTIVILGKPISYSEIGRIFSRDHSTVMTNIARYRDPVDNSGDPVDNNTVAV